MTDMFDADLREALLGTWRLVNYKVDVDGTLDNAFGDNPQGYLVYTPDDHMVYLSATRAHRVWPGPEVLELPPQDAILQLGFSAYCGTFEVRNGEVIHRREVGVLPGMSGTALPRSVLLDGDRLILGTTIGAHLEWQRCTDESRTSDSELRQALLGTWRLVSNQFNVDGTLVKPLGDNPQGYLVYTPDGHMFVQMATRAERSWPSPEELEQPAGAQLMAAVGFYAYCGTFEVRDGEVVHHQEFGILQRLSGRVETRSVVLDGDRLILDAPSGARNEWQRVHSEEPR